MQDPTETAQRSPTKSLRAYYQPGERLESERRLAEQMGVSRGSIREALKQLDQPGLLDIRQSRDRAGDPASRRDAPYPRPTRIPRARRRS